MWTSGQFTEDEIDMFSKLYADCALQLASEFRFQVIQGGCVGGSSVVNNAVCFDTPDNVLDRWNDKGGLNADLDLARYKECNAHVNKMIGVRTVGIKPDPDAMTYEKYLNPSGKLFKHGCELLGLDRAPSKLSSVRANIHGCLGCGYCNIGCAYEKKLSMLDTVLPDIQERFGADKFTILAGCQAWTIKSKGDTVISVIGKFKSGRKIEIKGKTFVVSAGAVSSSILLQRSGIAAGESREIICHLI